MFTVISAVAVQQGQFSTVVRLDFRGLEPGTVSNARRDGRQVCCEVAKVLQEVCSNEAMALHEGLA